MCLSVCVTFVVFTDCESCTRPISTNPGSMEAGECGLTRGTRFAARRLELVAVAGRLWISWCVLGGADFFVFFFRFFFFFLRTHTACCKYEATSCFIYLSTSTVDHRGDQVLYTSARRLETARGRRTGVRRATLSRKHRTIYEVGLGTSARSYKHFLILIVYEMKPPMKLQEYTAVSSTAFTRFCQFPFNIHSMLNP